MTQNDSLFLSFISALSDYFIKRALIFTILFGDFINSGTFDLDNIIGLVFN